MKVRLVVSGLPGMYGEARALLPRRDAMRVVLAAGLALVLAPVRASGRPRTQNALRHFAWSAWLAASYGAEVAKAVTAEHERHSLDPLDSECDLRNNKAGRRYGRLHVAEIVDLPTPVAVWRLLGIGRRKWRSGRLWAVRHGWVEPSHSRRVGGAADAGGSPGSAG
ncbi:DUF6973 domain-containing protein [Nocardioides sp. Iso805N]|uniref:DUF6973 domain-containing protein n=1 Tax=Nocardioides sp. Iso805N TaxID=1283287 RepID=UPI0012FB6AED|nr:hypothetical protein [Nocardioides sp. Iso805N]